MKVDFTIGNIFVEDDDGDDEEGLSGSSRNLATMDIRCIYVAIYWLINFIRFTHWSIDFRTPVRYLNVNKQAS